MSEKDVTPRQSPFPVKPKFIAIGVVVLLVIVIVSSSFYVVDQTEQAVLLTLGKFSRLSGAGLHFKIPLVQKNYNVPTQVVQNMSFGFRTERAGVSTVYAGGDYSQESLMLTGDLNIVDVEWIIQYRINEPRKWLFNVRDQQKTIRDISQSTINMLVGDRAILDVIGSERSNIELQGKERMNEIFNSYGLGINVITVRLQNIVPPEGSVQSAFEDVNKSIQDMNRFINEGKEAYNTEIPRARGEAEQMIREAEGYAQERVNEARGNVARFNSVYEEYRKDEEITKTRLYIEMVEDVFKGKEGTELIDRNLRNFIPFKALDSQIQPSSQGGTE